MFPTIYVSHGSPMILLENSAARDFLAGFGRELGRPRAILLVSAHFETSSPAFTGSEKPPMIYDFGGFPQPLFEMNYGAPGDPELARRAAGILNAAGFSASIAPDRGFDHGAWVPLKLLYPDAEIPVVEASVQPQAGAAHHYALGRALAELRADDVLVIGSGSLTHNLHELRASRGDIETKAPDWVTRFADWMNARIAAGAVEDVLRYRERAPYAKENHPSEEHFLPLPFAMGAAGEGARGKRVHTSHQYGVLMMDAYAFA